MGFLLDDVTHMLANQEPFEKIMVALDELRARSGIEEFIPSIEHFRATIHAHYQRPADECAAALDRYFALGPSLERRADAVILVCALVPVLSARYLDPLIAELEMAPKTPDLADTRKWVHEVRSRTLGKAP